MKDLLFILHLGGGNVIQMIPAYLQLKKAGFDMDVVYLKQYPTESLEIVRCFPCDEITQIDGVDMAKLKDDYKYMYKPPYLSSKGSYLRASADLFRERNSEVRQYLECLKPLDVGQEVLTQWKEIEPRGFIEGEYITIHNGGNPDPAWWFKRYLMFPRVVELLKKERPDLQIVCLGSDSEYVGGTIKRTGCTSQETAYWINHAKGHISNDTFTMHVAALVDTPSVAVFGCTSWDVKNIDKDFHSNVEVVHIDFPCSPCQKGWHWHPCRDSCAGSRIIFPCQNVPPQKVVEAFLKKI